MKLLLALLTFGLLLPVFIFAQTPGLPHQFFGTAKFISGTAVPNGLTVEAKIDGSVVGSSVTANGNYGYNPNLLFATDDQGVNAGKTIKFYIGGTETNETAIFVNGSSSNLNLTISNPTPTPTPSETPTPTPTPTPTSTPTPTPSPTPTPNPGGGGGAPPSTPTPTPTAMPLSADAQKVDSNHDGKIDVLDFNALMINWGSTSADNPADFNDDGKVDILDFNALMIYWN